MNNNELYHYGVKGMKWGVRRDARILANHRYNKAVKRLQTERAYGVISEKQYIDGLNTADKRKKKDLADFENQFRTAKTDVDRKRLGDNISKMAVDEVSDIKIQRGLAVANQLIGTANIASIGYTTAAMTAINPAFATAYIGAGAVTAAAEAGYRWVGRIMLDNWA